MGFPCPAGAPELLYSISYFATSQVSNQYLTVLDASGTQCDGQSILMTGGQATINGPPCTVPVEQQTWSIVKSLYRN